LKKTFCTRDVFYCPSGDANKSGGHFFLGNFAFRQIRWCSLGACVIKSRERAPHPRVHIEVEFLILKAAAGDGCGERNSAAGVQKLALSMGMDAGGWVGVGAESWSRGENNASAA